REWAVLRPLLEASCQKQGGANAANRLFINAILWRIRTGVPWRDMPERLGKWNSLARRFARWADKKVWHRLFTAIQEPDWEWVLVDSSSIKVHPQAAGAKKKRGAAKPSAAVKAGGRRKYMRLSMR
ncbi:IS5 family transposase, partial [Hymenobacter sp. P5342]|nr:IS5 family transposase [Hymenobacter lapidiphilus]